MRKSLLLILLLLVLQVVPGNAFGAKRVALVIGNGDYSSSGNPPLFNSSFK